MRPTLSEKELNEMWHVATYAQPSHIDLMRLIEEIKRMRLSDEAYNILDEKQRDGEYDNYSDTITAMDATLAHLGSNIAYRQKVKAHGSN